jgi:hypothetical protein
VPSFSIDYQHLVQRIQFAVLDLETPDHPDRLAIELAEHEEALLEEATTLKPELDRHDASRTAAISILPIFGGNALSGVISASRNKICVPGRRDEDSLIFILVTLRMGAHPWNFGRIGRAFHQHSVEKTTWR